VLCVCVCGVCVCCVVCVAHDYRQNTALLGSVYRRRSKQQKDEEICVMANDDFCCIADSITAITDRYRDWWEWELVSEKSITHTKFVAENPEWKSQSGRSRRGWRATEGQYEDLDLRVTNFIVLSQKFACFSSSLPVRLHRAANYFSLIICKISFICMKSV